MDQNQQSTLKDRLLKFPLLLVVGIVGTLILYAVIPSALERDLNLEPSATLEWSTHNSPGGSFSILLPTTPKVESYTIPVNDNEKVIANTYTAEVKDKFLFTIIVADLPQSLIIDDAETALVDTLDGMVKSHSDNELESYEMFTLGNLPAVQFVISGKTTTYWNRGIAVLDGDRKYIVQFYNKGSFDEDTYNNFIDSFSIRQ